MTRGVLRKARSGVLAWAPTATLLSAGLPVLLLAGPSAQASTPSSVTPIGVTLGNTTAGAGNSTYTIGFRTSSSGSLGANSTITFTAPAGTVFPSCSLVGCSAYSVKDVSGSATVSSASVSGSTVQIGLALASFSASDAVTVTISGVTNPTVASLQYSMQESTSSDSTPVPSTTYNVDPGDVASVTAVSGGGQSAKVGTVFQDPLVVLLQDKFGNNELGGTSVTFSAPSCGSTPCPSATLPGGLASEDVTTGTGGTASSGSLTADNTAGSYSVTATANSIVTKFSVRNVLPVAPGTVTVASPQAGVTSSYTIPFTTSAVGGCSSGCSITFTAPAGTAFPSTAGAYGIAVTNGHSATVGSVSTPQGPNSVAIQLSASTVAAGDTVTVTVTGVGNPTLARSGDTIEESTSTDSVPVQSPTYTITAAPAATIEPYIGSDQSAMTFGTFPSQLVARVTDAYNNAVPDVQVTFTLPDSMDGGVFSSCEGGTASECLSITDASGDASAGLIAGASGGQYDIVATTGQAHPAVFSVTVLQTGYWMVASDGGLFNHGGAPYDGSEGGTHLNKPVVGIASATNGGYYMVASDGGVFTFGGAPFYGSTGSMRLNAPVVGMAVDPQTGGYWLVASDGGIFNFNAPFYGSEGGTHLNKPIVGMASTPEGGYYLVASDGGIFNFGPGAAFYGSEGGTPLNEPIVGMATAQNGGYYMVASDGGIFNFGPGAPFLGSAVGRGRAPVVGMVVDPDSGGYWIAASNGAVYNVGGAAFYGDESAHPLNQPVVGIAASATP